MSALRAAAARWIEAGRIVGACEHLAWSVRRLGEIADAARARGETATAEALGALVAGQRAELARFERGALESRAHAERLLRELEQPGAALARRIVRTARAARRAWLAER